MTSLGHGTKARQLYMIELDDLTFMQLFWIVMIIVLAIFFGCNLLNVTWVFHPLT